MRKIPASYIAALLALAALLSLVAAPANGGTVFLSPLVSIRKLVGVELEGALRYKWVVKDSRRMEVHLAETSYHKAG